VTVRVALLIVMVVLTVLVSLKLVSAALVAVITQLPAAVGVRVEDAMVQSPLILVKLIAPVPVPPDVARERLLP